jgi:hypothetical protein
VQGHGELATESSNDIAENYITIKTEYTNTQQGLPVNWVYLVWQNRLNYFGSSALVIAIQPILTQRTSNGTTHWSVGSPPDATTVQQDRSRFTSHEGEFTNAQQLTNF